MHVCHNPKYHNELPDLCVLFWDGLKPRLAQQQQEDTAQISPVRSISYHTLHAHVQCAQTQVEYQLGKETFLIYISTMSTTRGGLFILSPVLQCVLQKHRTVGLKMGHYYSAK